MQKSYCCNSELRDSNYYGLGTCTKCGKLSHEYIEKETQRVSRELPREFEEYLKDQFGKNYSGLDDDMPDRFEYWLGNLEPQQLSDYKNSFEKSKPIATNKTFKTAFVNTTGKTIKAGSLVEFDILNGNLVKVTPPEQVATNKTSSTYTLENGHEEVGVEVSRSGKITLINPYTQESEFVFKGSDPERLARMGALLIEASKLKI